MGRDCQGQGSSWSRFLMESVFRRPWQNPAGSPTGQTGATASTPTSSRATALGGSGVQLAAVHHWTGLPGKACRAPKRDRLRVTQLSHWPLGTWLPRVLWMIVQLAPGLHRTGLPWTQHLFAFWLVQAAQLIQTRTLPRTAGLPWVESLLREEMC